MRVEKRILSIPEQLCNISRSHPKTYFLWCFAPFLNGTSQKPATFTSAHLQGQNTSKTTFKISLPNSKQLSFARRAWGRTLEPLLLEGWGSPGASY